MSYHYLATGEAARLNSFYGGQVIHIYELERKNLETYMKEHYSIKPQIKEIQISSMKSIKNILDLASYFLEKQLRIKISIKSNYFQQIQCLQDFAQFQQQY
ncbi:hypothetical protein ABPG72_004848 [Tetrahymena utriculariae]